MFPFDSYERWEFAGSVRRRKPEVADLDHVVIPRFGDVPGDGLFAEPVRVNLFFHAMDRLVAAGEITRAVKQTAAGPREKWGEKSRGCSLDGFGHDVWTADPWNWGSVLAIRTGPAEFAQALVLGLQRKGFWNNGRDVWNKRGVSCACGWQGSEAGRRPSVQLDHIPLYRDGNGDAWTCGGCGRGDGLKLARVDVPDEQTYFRLAGFAWRDPEHRGRWNDEQQRV